jgi:hypothetical protein
MWSLYFRYFEQNSACLPHFSRPFQTPWADPQRSALCSNTYRYTNLVPVLQWSISCLQILTSAAYISICVASYLPEHCKVPPNQPTLLNDVSPQQLNESYITRNLTTTRYNGWKQITQHTDWICPLRSSAMWRGEVLQVTNASGEHTASIFRVRVIIL